MLSWNIWDQLLVPSLKRERIIHTFVFSAPLSCFPLTLDRREKGLRRERERKKAIPDSNLLYCFLTDHGQKQLTTNPLNDNKHLQPMEWQRNMRVSCFYFILLPAVFGVMVSFGDPTIIAVLAQSWESLQFHMLSRPSLGGDLVPGISSWLILFLRTGPSILPHTGNTPQWQIEALPQSKCLGNYFPSKWSHETILSSHSNTK